ncbi:MGDG synthase family glycosyltransferase [Sporomusa acidovorans]|uniref:Processive diacylglycerol beta-glucosyltransferase n=1 Tax=Sporomusa acidovorans (strain ATCC 49682 / DSM 3132 / Mol) TaxID=1123286 RepID=A0ABZ3J3S5_SPOA4|nr:glycosyltransferase [Sporomusa acidovorans]OZC20048.1 processive diacylglycerol beta-glucosyltransferase [Sporomusa acidovorans DSM 3132]SDD46594.1 processive 1,2-diacylglycerol beta-glucosyltransferase [Sporomusa acidovorans]
MVNRRVLFISAPIGAGHIRAAQAVSQILRADYGCQTQLCNIFDFFPAFIGQTVLKIYLKILALFPAVYGSAYKWGNHSRLALFGRELVSRILARRMVNYISDFKPAVIICTHATPAGIVAWLKNNRLITAPAAAIITDFVVHRLWVYPEFNCYFVAHPAMRDYLCQHGVASRDIEVTGIPVSPSFSLPVNKDELYAKLKLFPDYKTIMIMGGGAGILPITEILELCSQIDGALQFIAIAGKNQALYRDLLRLESVSKHPVRVFGYVENIHELMSIADLLISKPGGMSAAEALAKGVPLVIFRPIPGQEIANTRYLLDNAAAFRADSLSELKSMISRMLVEDNTSLIELRKNAVSLGQPDAARNIAGIIAKNYLN